MADSALCRLCLEHAEDLLDMFQEQGEGPKIIDVLTHYSVIELNHDDEISNKICSNCWSSVFGFYEFCMRVQKIQESISSIIYVDNKTDLTEVVLATVCNDDADDEEHQEDVAMLEVKTEEVVETIVEVCCETEGDLTDSISSRILIDVSENVPVAGQKDTPESSERPLTMEETKKEENEHKRKSAHRRVRRKATTEEQNHEQVINSFFTLNCELCTKEFASCTKLFLHYELTHKIRGFIVCCGKKYFKQTKIAEHVLWHKKPEMFRCTKCDLEKVFPNKKQLETHMVTHVDPKCGVFTCEFCVKTFVKKYRYDQHKLTHLRPEEKKYICEECGKPYATESLLRVHVRAVHINSYAHMCEICAKVFKSRVFFEKHQLEHMGQSLPRVQCQICNAWMKNEHTMRAHIRLHEDEGAVHECDMCGKTGPSRNAILKHKRYVHFSERKFKCTLCEKGFKRAVSLKEHMTLHTGEVLYRCTFCTKTFNSGANMFAHKKKIHYSEWKLEKELNNK